MLTKAWDSNNRVVRAEVWGSMIQEELQEELTADTIVQWWNDFGDGDQFNVPTLASLSSRDYTENTAITVDDPSVGEFTLTIDKYVQSGIGIVDKLKHDIYYMEVLTSKFPQQCLRAIRERLEADIMDLHKKQTTNDANTINGAAHRYVASGTSSAFSVKDFALAKLALDKAFSAKGGRKAIVDPWVSYQLTQIDNVIRQDVYGANAVMKEGFGTSTYLGRYLGFDVFESNSLDNDTALDHATGGSLIANLFLGPEAFVGAMRLAPEIEASRDWEHKRDVYHVTSRYGLGLYRPEDLVVVLSAAV